MTDPFAAVEQAVSTLTRDGAGSGMRVPRPTAAPGALRPFAEGESHMRAGRIGEATSSYEEALALDSTFAWAHYRLSVAHDWAGRSERAREASDRALATSRRLSPEERRQLDAWRSYLWGEVARAAGAYEALAAARPGDAELLTRLRRHPIAASDSTAGSSWPKWAKCPTPGSPSASWLCFPWAL